MTISGFTQPLIDFVREHQFWAAPIVFALAFGESLAFLSLLLPAWAALVGIGAVIGATGIDFIPIWLAGAAGAALGDWVSYWFGATFKDRIAHMWPLSRHPELIPRGHRFMERWGIVGVFLGRFFGPLRAVVPLVAGIFEMPYWPFQLANVTSALVWAAVLLAPGIFGMKYFFPFQ
jgi:membrane protein DedA with SNARE-associated domain